jgi:hypothetical protein
MAVVINRFEATGEAPAEPRPDTQTPAPTRIEPAVLRAPIRRLAQRHARLRAY